MKTACLIALIALSSPVNAVAADVDADTEADRILGVWATEKAEAHVEISRDAGGYNGTIIWLKEPFYSENEAPDLAGQPKVDRENPDPALRDRGVVGLRIMEGFRYTGRDRWADGTIYDPENGKTYKCRLLLTGDGELKVRGYVGISLFGRTSVWTPVLQRIPAAGE